MTGSSLDSSMSMLTVVSERYPTILGKVMAYSSRSGRDLTSVGDGSVVNLPGRPSTGIRENGTP